MKYKKAIEFLQLLGKEMKEQDSDCQAAPRFWVVAENKKEYGIHRDYADGYVVVDSDGGEWETPEGFIGYLVETGYLKMNQIDKQRTYDFDEIIELLDSDEYSICGYRDCFDVVTPNTFFLTKRECKEHVAKNNYHYNSPHSYAMTAWRSPQVERLYDIIENTEWETVLRVLREQAEREKGCEYCRGNVKELVDGDTTIFIDQEDKVFFADWGGSYYLAWEYCPMCGRRLEVDHEQ